MLNIFTAIILIFSVILALGLLWQKSMLNKILFLNSLTSVLALLICLLGTYQANDSYLDIAIIYFLLSFIATGGYLRFFLHKKKSVDINGI